MVLRHASSSEIQAVVIDRGQLPTPGYRQHPRGPGATSAFAGITRIESGYHLAVFRGLQHGEDEKTLRKSVDLRPGTSTGERCSAGIHCLGCRPGTRRKSRDSGGFAAAAARRIACSVHGASRAGENARIRWNRETHKSCVTSTPTRGPSNRTQKSGSSRSSATSRASLEVSTKRSK